MGYVLISYVEYSLMTNTVVRSPIASSQQGQTMAKSNNILLRQKRGTSGWNVYTTPPCLISAISISHNIFLNISEVLFFSGFYWCPPYSTSMQSKIFLVKVHSITLAYHIGRCYSKTTRLEILPLD